MDTTLFNILIRVAASVLFGGLIGLERELTDHPAGIRTHILVSIGACIFTTLSLYAFPGAPGGDRVAAAVVTGIGFIGGGAILRSRGGWVTGLTTAASLWSCAAIGMLAGAGFFVAGIIVTVINLLVLQLVDRAIGYVSPWLRFRSIPLQVAGSYSDKCYESMVDYLDTRKCKLDMLSFTRDGDGGDFEFSGTARLSPGTNIRELSDGLLALEGISKVSWGERD